MTKPTDDTSQVPKAPSLDDLTERAKTALRARLVSAPYQTLGVTVGLGIVIGGGMWRLLARSLFRIGARTFIAAVVPAVTSQDRFTRQEA